MGCGSRATTRKSSIARCAEKVFLGALAGTGMGGITGHAATNAMATNATSSPRRTVHDAAVVRFNIVPLVALMVSTFAHGSPHDDVCASLVIWSLDLEHPFGLSRMYQLPDQITFALWSSVIGSRQLAVAL